VLRTQERSHHSTYVRVIQLMVPISFAELRRHESPTRSKKEIKDWGLMTLWITGVPKKLMGNWFGAKR
jgi:hypothetical protein